MTTLKIKSSGKIVVYGQFVGIERLTHVCYAVMTKQGIVYLPVMTYILVSVG